VINPYLGYTLTRLHYRYASSDLGDDLVFREAPTLQGGRGVPDQQGNLDPAVQTGAGVNNFQGRYVILHPWTEPLLCEHPVRGTWGGPPGNSMPTTQATSNNALRGAAPVAGSLESLIAENIPSLDVTASNPVDPLGGGVVRSGAESSGCSGCAMARRTGWSAAAVLGAVFAIGFGRRRSGTSRRARNAR
jgi:hypothetical protein